MAGVKTDETAFVDAARNVCGRIERECGITVPPDTLSDVARLIRAIVDMYVTAETTRAVAICEARASLWRGTFQASGPSEHGREECRSRANEAEYIAAALREDRVHDSGTPA
jgi:hypothetical protein